MAKSKKIMIVVPTKNNHRIITTQRLLDTQKYADAYINPDLSRVEGIPPHMWKPIPGKNAFRKMTPPELMLLNRRMEKEGTDYDVAAGLARLKELPAPQPWYVIGAKILLAGIVLAGAGLLFYG